MFLLYWKYIVLALLLAGIGGYMYYNHTVIKGLREKNIIQKIQILEQAENVRILEESKDKEGAALATIMDKNKKVNEELNRYLEIFDRHNLNKLARAKPGLIETRVNAGTKKLFEELENETSDSSN